MLVLLISVGTVANDVNSGASSSSSSKIAGCATSTYTHRSEEATLKPKLVPSPQQPLNSQSRLVSVSVSLLRLYSLAHWESHQE